MCAIELLDSCIELYALFTFHEELGNLGTSLHILWLYLPYLSFLRTPLGLGMRWSEGVLWPPLLMILESLLRLCVPLLAFVMGHVLPRQTDNLGQRAVICFNLGRDMLALNKRRSEQDERVGWARDVVFSALFAVCRTSRGAFGAGRWE